MANHKSAIKRAKQSEERRQRNRARKTRMKNVVKAVEEAIIGSNKELAVDEAPGSGIGHRQDGIQRGYPQEQGGPQNFAIDPSCE